MTDNELSIPDLDDDGGIVIKEMGPAELCASFEDVLLLANVMAAEITWREQQDNYPEQPVDTLSNAHRLRGEFQDL